VLVTGGAGYVGAHTVRALQRHGVDVVVYDNLSRGHRWAVGSAAFVEGDLADRAALLAALGQGIEAVVHLAAVADVGESVADPARYYETNVTGSLNLLGAMRARGLRHLVWSSTSAVYGVPRVVPIPEDHPREPVNPYGASKLMVERMLHDYDHAYGFRSVTLRYFNAAGADPDGTVGETHDPEMHLLPRVLLTALGRYPEVEILGGDYPTPDGTCVRDYVHIADLCQAHLLALESLLAGGPTAAYNLGNGHGFSVQEVIAAAEAVTGRRVPVGSVPRRPGDPARLVADASLARSHLGWRPRYDRLETILEHAWAWEQKTTPALRPERDG
jgi:UDP-glucose-4-epimerase GalE